MQVKFSQNQLENISRYCSDISKIVVGSVVISFFVQTGNMHVTPLAFVIGVIVSLLLFGFSVILNK
jgi:hypothetical protein